MKQGKPFGTFPIHNQACLNSPSFVDWWGAQETKHAEGHKKLALILANKKENCPQEQHLLAICKLGQVREDSAT